MTTEIITQNQASAPKRGIVRGAKHIGVGAIISGTVFRKRPREIFIELGGYGTGRIYGREYLRARSLIARLHEGDEVAVKISDLDDGIGNYEVSLQDIQEIGKWDQIKDRLRTKAVLELLVLEANKGGLIVDLEGIKGFVPVSQLTPEHYPRVQNDDKGLILESLRKLVGKNLALRVISADPTSNKLILSERAAKQELYSIELKRYAVGQVVSGRVVGVSSFGIFIRFQDEPPLEGLVHVSEIPEDQRDLTERLKINDALQAKIIKVDDDRVNLTLRDLTEDPWLAFIRERQIGDAVTGTIVELNEDIFAVVEVAGVRGITFDHLDQLAVGTTASFTIQDFQPGDRKLILAHAA